MDLEPFARIVEDHTGAVVPKGSLESLTASDVKRQLNVKLMMIVLKPLNVFKKMACLNAEMFAKDSDVDQMLSVNQRTMLHFVLAEMATMEIPKIV